jgi:hypothetical protein
MRLLTYEASRQFAEKQAGWKSSGFERAKMRRLIENANTLGFVEQSVE